jgi:uncharacterized cupredoxin-like copper-binding protein
LVVLPLLAACGSDKKSGSSSAIEVKAGDSSCEVARTDLSGGTTTFSVKNTGSKITEMYIYGADGEKFTKVIGEVENVGPGTSRELKAELAAGTYEIACKPGQTGDGIRTKITVTGGSAAPTEAKAYDREIELTTDGKTLSGLSGSAKVGERIEFKLANKASADRTLEVKDPSGGVAGEIADIKPGAEAEFIVKLATAGTWKVIIEGEGAKDIIANLTVS